MDWRDVRYSLALGGIPKIERITIGVHNLGDAQPHIHTRGHWYLHFYSYHAEVTIAGQRFPIQPGYAGLIPPSYGSVSYRFQGRSTHLYAHFSLREGTGTPVQIPAMQDLGQRFLPLSDRFYEAIEFFRSQPERAEVRLADILWELAQPALDTDPPQLKAAPNVVREACHLIDQLMHLHLSVLFIADHVERSHNQLTRLFRQHMGTTVVAYIRQRRALRAKHLLLHSWLPIKTIARQVGVPDPQHFSKMIRKELGASPKQIRERAR